MKSNFARRRWSLRQMLWLMGLTTLAVSHVWTSFQLHQSRAELERLRSEAGYLNRKDDQHVAATRIPDDTPLSYRFRAYIPANQPTRLAYGTRLRAGQVVPDWYSYLRIQPGESVISVRIAADPRDEQWKITAAVRHKDVVSRSGTVLPEEQVKIFRGSYSSISSGTVGTDTVEVAAKTTLNLLEDKWLTDESPLVLYGQQTSDTDTIGVFLQLQPD